MRLAFFARQAMARALAHGGGHAIDHHRRVFVDQLEERSPVGRDAPHGLFGDAHVLALPRNAVERSEIQIRAIGEDDGQAADFRIISVRDKSGGIFVSDEQSIRPFLDRLERHGALLRIGKTVDPIFELSAFLSAADAGPALLFESVKGSKMRVAGNLFNGRERIAAALDVEAGELLPRLRSAIDAPLPAARAAHAPVQSVVVAENPLAALPVPRFFERESRPYITAGAIVARDPDSGRGNLSFARLAVLDGRSAIIIWRSSPGARRRSGASWRWPWWWALIPRSNSPPACI